MLTLTEAASRKLSEIMTQQTEPVAGLRVFVQKGGCSGYSYGMSLAPETLAGDWVGEFDGVKVLVDPESAKLLSGIRIDFVESLQGSGFTIHNPNAVRSCGCGSSFETEESAAGEGQPAHGESASREERG